MQVSQEELQKPKFGSVYIFGPPGSGKTASLASIHKVLRLRKLCTKIAFFDFDERGYESFTRMAIEGRETYYDKPGTVQPWLEDVIAFRYPIKRARFTPGTKDNPNVSPNRDRTLAWDFQNDFNTEIDEKRVDARTQLWKPGMELGAIIYDSLTGLSDLYEDAIWLSRGKEFGEKAGTGKTVEWTEWLLLGEDVRSAYMTAMALPCYFLTTGHEDAREKEVRSPDRVVGREAGAKLTTGKWTYMPLLVKSLATRISKDFSAVIRSTVDHKWQMVPTEASHTEGIRTRGKDNLPPFLDKQDLSLVLDI